MTASRPDQGSPPLADLPGPLVLAGAGKMGGALLEGWLARGLPDGAATVVDPAPSDTVSGLAASGRVRLGEAPGPAAILVLGIKPQGLEEAARALAPSTGPDTLLVSILAGKTIADLRRAFPAVRSVVRAMPNLPASIGQGATGAYANEAAGPAGRNAAHALLACNGVVEWVEREELIDAVTALSGSGPAYVFHLVEAMEAAGIAAGLPPDLSGRLARQTVIGSASLLGASDLPPSRLRENVTSKGGTTAAALAVLAGPDGLTRLMTDAIAAAKRRAGELSG